MGGAAGSQLHFMHPDTYEQETVDKELFGDMYDYFIEDMEAFLSFHEGEVVAGTSDDSLKVHSVSGLTAVISSCGRQISAIMDSSVCICNRFSASTSFIECCQHRHSGQGQ